ncbi:hypothetical protein RVF83_09020 [Gordonia rubripertincta]|uniref:DUF2993 domain-containing protein n=2 Tax=Gordonia rubripertincta TaxID=36822 RepID=A0AAW6RAH7_GORRU|nr:hypothetical protein [Gordonia rubripertincta]MDG6781110.1 hypothetical protein [Gordonia rubripertincta]NKY62405.1 hypothetical protein [Gordonia rubripertincta]TSD94014.1 hypothetical protein FOV72_18345 [Gordonia rubripertincta]GAB87320.1 hypothetical protein GORBP_100_00280 [Gordonia rubripertincta NBRC 101908]
MSDNKTPGDDPRDQGESHDPTESAGPTGNSESTGDDWRPVDDADRTRSVERTAGTDVPETGETEQFPTAPIAPGAQAYSSVPPSAADTTDLSGGLGQPGTSQFAPGETPYGDDSSEPLQTPGSGPVLTSPRKRRSTKKIVALSTIAVLLLVVIGAVGSELYLRNKVTNCLEESFSGLTGVPTSVSLSRKPIILQGSGDVPYVQVDTKDGSDPQGVRLHMRADGISGDNSSTDIRSLRGDGFIPYERIVELSKEGAPAGAGGQSTGNGASPVGSVEEITGNAADGTFEVQAGFPVMFFSVPVSATIKPVLKGGRVEFEVVKASALVFGIPPDFAQQIVDQITTSALGPFFDEVQVDQLKVTDTGLEFAISGSDVQLTNEMTGNEQQSGCSV